MFFALFMAYGFWVILIASVLYILYRFADNLLGKYLAAKREQTATLKEIADALRERK